MVNKITFDLAEIVSVIGASVMGLIYFLLKRFIADWDSRLEKVEEDLHEIKEDLPKKYVYKQDFKEELKTIKTELHKIYNVLINK